MARRTCDAQASFKKVGFSFNGSWLACVNVYVLQAIVQMPWSLTHDLGSIYQEESRRRLRAVEHV